MQLLQNQQLADETIELQKASITIEQLTSQQSQLEAKAKELEESVSYQKVQTEKTEM